MSKFLSNKKEYISYGSVLIIGLLMSALAVSASTTISTSITTGGTLNVTGLGTFVSASTTNISSSGSVYLATSSGIVGIGATSPEQLARWRERAHARR